MSLDNDNSKRVFKELEADFTIPLVISENVLSQITYLHHFVGTKEWSGLLIFSETAGSIEELHKLELRAEAVYPMDIGNSTYTEFDYDESIIDVYSQFDMLDGDKITKRIGTVHTHHSMKTFFSGTDMGELHNNTDKHLYYLSLIVNFETDFKAKIAVLGEEDSTVIYRGKSLHTQKMKKLYIVDCDILVENDFAFVDRVNLLKEKNTKKQQEFSKGKIKNPEMFFPDYDFTSYSKPQLTPTKNKNLLTHWEIQKILGALISQDEDNTSGLYLAVTETTKELKLLTPAERKNDLQELSFFIENYLDVVLESIVSFQISEDLLPDVAEECLNTLAYSQVSSDPYNLIKILKDGLQSYRFTR